jgi:hypothetical protein
MNTLTGLLHWEQYAFHRLISYMRSQAPRESDDDLAFRAYKCMTILSMAQMILPLSIVSRYVSSDSSTIMIVLCTASIAVLNYLRFMMNKKYYTFKTLRDHFPRLEGVPGRLVLMAYFVAWIMIPAVLDSAFRHPK